MFCGVCAGCWLHDNRAEPVWGSARDGLLSSTECGFGLLLRQLGEGVVELLPGDLSLQLPLHSLPWGTEVCLPVMGLVMGLLFMLRLIQSVRSWLYVRREKQLLKTPAARIAEKCQLMDRLCAAKKELAMAEMSLRKTSFPR